LSQEVALAAEYVPASQKEQLPLASANLPAMQGVQGPPSETFPGSHAVH
jgi:hypothetical protein